MRILIVSFYFPPYNNIGSVRVGKLAKYLTQLGHDVRVLTADAQLFPKALALEIPESSVIYTRWINVRRPAEILFRRRENTPATPSGDAGRANPLRRIKSWVWTFYRAIFYSPDMQIGWYPYALKAGVLLAEIWKPEIVYASAVPYTSLLVARSLAHKFQIPWFAEFRDLWVDNHFYAHPSWRRFFESKFERFVLRSAKGFITVSEPLAETLRSKYSQPVLVATNGFDPSDFPLPLKSFGSKDKLRIVYTGGLNRCKYDLSPLFKALASLGPLAEHFEIAFFSNPADLALARSEASKYRVDHLLSLRQSVPYLDALRAQAEADLLLFLIWNDPKDGRGVFSGKFFEYLANRRPILAIGPENNVAAKLIQVRNLGLVSEDASQITAQLLRWLEQKQSKGLIESLPQCVSNGFTREDQTKKISDFLIDQLSAVSSKKICVGVQ